jgi:exodeoxyribonuclease-3
MEKMGDMKIITYNVNGIRAAVAKGFLEWVTEENPDILCVQETKAQPDQVVDIREKLEGMGYFTHWNSAEKKGYSGVATFSKQKPNQVVVEDSDMEGRILRTDFGDITVLNCYFPSGTTGEERQGFKMDFLGEFREFIGQLKKEREQLIVVGDYNIAHTEMDIHDPVGNKKSTGFLPEERAWMTDWFGSGFVDCFREMNPGVKSYSWWTYRFNARKNNKGWRIDYISISESLRSRLMDAGHLGDVVHSDHCPVYAILK